MNWMKVCLPDAPKTTTSYFWGVPPSIPGDPTGSQPDGGRPFFQQSTYGRCRHMALDHEFRLFCGMAGGKIGRHSQTFPDGLQLSHLPDRDGKPRVLEVLHPTGAAPAIRICER